MTGISSLFTELGLDTKGFKTALKSVDQSLSAFSSTMEKMATSASKNWNEVADSLGVVNQSVKDVNASISALEAGFTKSSKKMGKSVDDLYARLGKTNQLLNNMRTSNKATNLVLREQARAVNASTQAMAAFAKQQARATVTQKAANTAMRNHQASLSNVVHGYRDLRTLVYAVGVVGIGKVVGGLVQANTTMEALTRGFVVATGSMEKAQAEMDWLRNITNKLGLEFYSVAERMKAFAAAAQNTSLEGQGVRDVFRGLLEAGRAMGLDIDRIKLSLLALEQMMSKGTVQTEELRRQLGEHLPGAFRLAAEAMGMTTRELNKALKKGEVFADDLLPRLSDLLHEKFAKSAMEAAEIAQSYLARLHTAFMDFKVALSSGEFIEVVIDKIEVLTQYLKDNQDALRDIFELVVNFGEGFFVAAEGISAVVTKLAELISIGGRIPPELIAIASMTAIGARTGGVPGAAILGGGTALGIGMNAAEEKGYVDEFVEYYKSSMIEMVEFGKEAHMLLMDALWGGTGDAAVSAPIREWKERRKQELAALYDEEIARLEADRAEIHAKNAAATAVEVDAIRSLGEVTKELNRALMDTDKLAVWDLIEQTEFEGKDPFAKLNETLGAQVQFLEEQSRKGKDAAKEFESLFTQFAQGELSFAEFTKQSYELTQEYMQEGNYSVEVVEKELGILYTAYAKKHDEISGKIEKQIETHLKSILKLVDKFKLPIAEYQQTIEDIKIAEGRVAGFGAKEAAHAMDAAFEKLLKAADGAEDYKTILNLLQKELRTAAITQEEFNERVATTEYAAYRAAKAIAKQKSEIVEMERELAKIQLGSLVDPEILFTSKAFEKELKKAVTEREKIEEQLQNELIRLTSTGVDRQMALLDKKLEHAKKVGADETLIAEVEAAKRTYIAQKEAEETYEFLADGVVEFVNVLVGEGESLADWWDDLWKRMLGMVMKAITEMTLAWAVGMRDMSKLSSSTQMLSNMTGLGSLFGMEGGEAGAMGGTSKMGTVGQVAAVSALAFVVADKAYEQAAGILGLNYDEDSKYGVAAGALLGSFVLPGLGSFVGATIGGHLAGKDHTQRRMERGGEWLDSFVGVTGGVGALSDLPGLMTEFDKPYKFDEDLQEFVRRQKNEGSSAALKYTGMKGQAPKDEWMATIATMPDLTIAVANSLNEMGLATDTTFSALADYGEIIQLTSKYMEDWEEDAQAMGQALIDYYNELTTLAIADIFAQAYSGAVSYTDALEALAELGMKPLEQYTAAATQSLNDMLTSVELNSEEMMVAYQIYKDAALTVEQLTEAQEQMAEIQAVLASSTQLTEEELNKLIAYYRQLDMLLEGTVEDWDAFATAQAEALPILEEMSTQFDSLAESIAAARMQVQGFTEDQILAASFEARMHNAEAGASLSSFEYAKMNMVAGADVDWQQWEWLIDWFMSPEVDAQVFAEIAEWLGMDEDAFMSFILTVNDGLNSAEVEAAKFAEEMEDLAVTLRTAQGQLSGMSSEQAKIYGMGVKYGWGMEGPTMQQVQTTVDFLAGATPEEVQDLAARKGVGFSELINDVMYLAEQFGLLGDTTQDLTAAWTSFVDTVDNQLLDLRTTTANPQDVFARLGIAQSAISGVLGGSSITGYLGSLSGEDQLAAARDLQNLYTQYLGVGQEAYQRPSSEYQAIFNEVISALSELRAFGVEQATEYELMVDQLAVLGSIDRGIKTLIAQNGGENAVNTTTTSSSAPFDPTYGMAALGTVPVPQAASGMERVPYDMLVKVHADEAILTPEQGEDWRNGKNITVNNYFYDSNQITRQMVEEVMVDSIRRGKGREAVRLTAAGK